ncbi:MAG: sigma-70 family RNA polymerase sigma factor [Phycisphaerales bacterium JB041]
MAEDRPDSPTALGAPPLHEQSPDDWIPRVYQELRRMARQEMRHEVRGTLQTTVLVHEVYLRLFAGREMAWENRAHFFGAAARAMRQILIDHARARRAVKRGGGARPRSLEGRDVPAPVADPERLLDLHEAIDRLERVDGRKAQIVMLRFFAGLSIAQTARVLDLSVTTVKNEWNFARAWLFREMSAASPDVEPGDG